MESFLNEKKTYAFRSNKVETTCTTCHTIYRLLKILNRQVGSHQRCGLFHFTWAYLALIPLSTFLLCLFIHLCNFEASSPWEVCQEPKQWHPFSHSSVLEVLIPLWLRLRTKNILWSFCSLPKSSRMRRTVVLSVSTCCIEVGSRTWPDPPCLTFSEAKDYLWNIMMLLWQSFQRIFNDVILECRIFHHRICNLRRYPMCSSLSDGLIASTEGFV